MFSKWFSKWISARSSLAILGVILGTLATTAAPAAEPVKPIRVLLVLGGCCHDYDAQKDILAQGISERAHVEVVIAYDPDTTTAHLNPVYQKPDWYEGFDVVIHDECSSDVKDEAIIDRILEPHRQGIPAVLLHCAMHSFRSEGFPEMTPWFEFTGLQTTGHGPHLPITLQVNDKNDPLVKSLADWETGKEELYNNVTGKLLPTAKSLARGRQVVKDADGNEKVELCDLAWTNLYQEKTRVFATSLGHYNDTVNDDRYLDMVTRALLWSCDKLNADYLKEPVK